MKIVLRGDIVKGMALVSAAAVCWGIGGTVGKLLFHSSFSPLAITTFRSIIALLVLSAAMSVLRIAPKFSLSDFPFLLMLGGSFFGVTYFYFATISLTNVAIGVMLEYTAVIWLALHGLLTHRLKLNVRTIGVLLLSMIGCYFLVGAHDHNLFLVNRLGLFTGILSALCFAVYALLGEAGHKRGFNSLSMMWSNFLVCSLIGIFLMWQRGEFLSAFSGVSSSSLYLFLYLGVFGAALPFTMHLHGLRYLPPFVVTVVAMLEPLVAAVCSFFILHETFTNLQIVGGVLLAIAVIVVHRYSEEHV